MSRLPDLRNAGTGEYSQRRIRLPFTNEAKTLWVQKIGHDYVYQGDIVVDDDRTRPIFMGRGDRDDRWVDGVIPLDIDVSVTAQPLVLEALYDALNAMMWQTEIRFVPRTNQKDYVQVVVGPADHGEAGRSSVGRRGGKQQLTIASPDPGSGVVLHELLHAAGAFHEQSRKDRTNFVDFDLTGMSPGQSANFDAIDEQTVGRYDYASLMHYRADAFSPYTPARPTIFCKTNGARVACPGVMGQRNGLSTGDIAGLDALYSEISRFSNGGWDATMTRNLDRTSNPGVLRGSVHWQPAEGMPILPNWRDGNVDYVQMSVSSPTQETIRWANRKKTRHYMSWKPLPAGVYQPLSMQGVDRILRYSLAVPTGLPLKVTFDTLSPRWGGFPPAPSYCDRFTGCSYGLSATSTSDGSLSISAGGSATIDYRIDGEWGRRPNVHIPQVIEVSPYKRALEHPDWITRPIDAVYRVEATIRLQEQPTRTQRDVIH